MPNLVRYSKQSIIYFAGDSDDRIFILQTGTVILTSIDPEYNKPSVETIKPGEFFGVKSALGHFVREETATSTTECTAIVMTIAEFDHMLSINPQLIFKMLHAFSAQLRRIHKKIESILDDTMSRRRSQPANMRTLAQCFFDDEQYRSCCDVCLKLLHHFPDAPHKQEIKKLYNNSKMRYQQLARLPARMGGSGDQNQDFVVNFAALQHFQLPAFKRFSKLYQPGQVIISEFEPGDSFYLIQEGRVQTLKLVAEAKKNLDILNPGEFFGEMAILDNSPRSATCMAITKVRCLEFNKDNFQTLIAGNPHAAFILLKMFCKRIYDQKRRLKILTTKDLPTRIAAVFVMYDEMIPPAMRPSDEKRVFFVTVQEIAHWAGLSQEAAQDEISRYAERHKIEVLTETITVFNIGDMRRQVEMHELVHL